MITRYLYRHPQIVWLLVVTICVAGFACLTALPRLEDPILRRRVGVVSTALYGADAREIESTVTIPLERWLGSIPGVKQIRSSSKKNISNIVVELDGSVEEPSKIWSSVENLLKAKQDQLPSETTAPELTVFPLKAYAAIVAMTPTSTSGASLFEQRRLAQQLRSRVLSLDGTEAVDIFGDPGEEWTIAISPDRLAATGLTPGAIAEQIRNDQTVPAGASREGSLRIPVELEETTTGPNRIGNIRIRGPSQPQPLTLSEIATIEQQMPDTASTAAIIDGRDALVIGALVEDTARVDLWAEKLQQTLAKFTRSHGDTVTVNPIFLQSVPIRERMQQLIRNLAMSTIAVILLTFLVMGWRCMIVVAVTLPLSTSLVLCGMRWLAIPIHQMSVTGLIVALGLLIDNAIVMVEEVRSRILLGRSPLSAMQESVGHLSVPLLGSTLTTVLAFLPIATMPGSSGEFVGSIAISVILAISSSYVLAVTIVPPLVFMLGVDARRTQFLDSGIRLGPIVDGYRRSLQFVFRYPVLGIALGATLPIIGFYSSRNLERQFFPPSDRAQLQVELELPQSSTMESLRGAVHRAGSLLADEDRVRHQNWFLGESAPTFYYNVVPRRRASPNYAQAFVDIQSGTDMERCVNQLQSKLDSEILDARVVVSKLAQGPPFEAPVEVLLVGNNLDDLRRGSADIRRLLSQNPWVTHTRSDLESTSPKLLFRVDSPALRESGISRKELSRFLYTVLEGADAGRYLDDGESINARVRVDFGQTSALETLEALPVVTPSSLRPMPPNRSTTARSTLGGPPLGSLGEFGLGGEINGIVRRNGERVNKVYAYLRPGVLPSVVLRQFQSDLRDSTVTIPESCRMEFGGEAEQRQQAISTLMGNALTLFSVMLLTLVAVTGSFRSAAVIAAVGGFAVGLALLSLQIFGFPFGFMSIVGTMGLVGVAINDSIVVLATILASEKSAARRHVDEEHEIDAIHFEQRRHRPDHIAEVVIGCTRHVMATTLSTMIGFLPLVLGGGKFWPPLAVVVSGGVAGATLLALYFVPSCHILFSPSPLSATTDDFPR